MRNLVEDIILTSKRRCFKSNN